VRLTALVAAVPAIALLPGASSVAVLDSPSNSGRHEIVVADAEVKSSEPSRIPGRLKLESIAPVSPRSTFDCFPIGRVRPTKPGAVKMPHATPIRPGPVPLPTVTTTCAVEQVPLPSELINRPLRAP
jgi:hypothetical protein